jgi:hypothetical protein
MDNPETLVTLGTKDTVHTVVIKKTLEKTEGVSKNGQSRTIDNIGYTRDRTKTNKAKTQDGKLKRLPT